jgi:DNA-binding protein YbaB
MRMTLHAVVVSHHQAGLIVTIKMACAGQIVAVTIRPLRNNPGQKI